MYNDMTMYRNRNSVNIQHWYIEMVIIILFVCDRYNDWLNDMISVIKTEFVGNQKVGLLLRKGKGSK